MPEEADEFLKDLAVAAESLQWKDVSIAYEYASLELKAVWWWREIEYHLHFNASHMNAGIDLYVCRRCKKWGFLPWRKRVYTFHHLGPGPGPLVSILATARDTRDKHRAARAFH